MRPHKKNDRGLTAEQWLTDFLISQEQLARDVYDCGAEQGFSKRTLNYAKAAIGAQSGKKYGEWYWYATITAPEPAVTTQHPNTDEYGYSTEIPKVKPTVLWIDVLRRMSALLKSGAEHSAIVNEIMEMAYPNAGLTESIIAKALRANGVDVPNKVLDSTN